MVLPFKCVAIIPLENGWPNRGSKPSRGSPRLSGACPRDADSPLAAPTPTIAAATNTRHRSISEATPRNTWHPAGGRKTPRDDCHAARSPQAEEALRTGQGRGRPGPLAGKGPYACARRRVGLREDDDREAHPSARAPEFRAGADRRRDGTGEDLRTADHPCRPGRLRRSCGLRKAAGTGTGKRGNAEHGRLEATALRRTGRSRRSWPAPGPGAENGRNRRGPGSGKGPRSDPR